VGGDAGQFGTTASSFHQHNLRKAERWPHSLLATATHDTKRGEDTRARINVLSEMPVQWRDAINRWSRLNADKKTSIAGQPAPDPNDEYLLYQTLVGAWPASSASLRDPRHPRGTHDDAAVAALPQRIADYMIKALREAKARTNWTDPNEPYETAVREFATHVLDPHASSAFLVDFQSFQQTVSYFGQFNSLSQLLLKIASPGVPDFYQGTELWDFSLVDPDNRRAVDYSLRRRLLAVLVQEGPALLPELADRTHTGEIKLFLMHQALKFRRQNREVFEHGGYLPLEASGPRREHVCAFARIIGGRVVIAAAPRLVFGLMQGQARAPLGESAWQDTALDLGAGTLAGEYQDVLTGERISTLSRDGGPCLRMSAAFALLPVALLARVAE
jgi:(1->4)-alpha-D-glucan 1-alpha-D-glucosylmutase